MLQLRINRTSNAREVIKANQQLLETYRLVADKKAGQEQLIRDAENCRAAAQAQGVDQQTVSNNLPACIAQLEKCRRRGGQSEDGPGLRRGLLADGPVEARSRANSGVRCTVVI